MRKAFTLVEMLVLVAVAPPLMILISRVFATFIRDIPRETRVVQQSTMVQDMLVQLRRDVDRAVALPQRFDDVQAGDATLLVKQPQAVICYRFETGQAVRSLLQGPAGVDPNEQRVWRIDDAVVTCRPWVRDGETYAVEVHSHVRQKIVHRQKDQFVNSYVFFIHGLGKGGEVQ
jgi:type II secretory pathway pseudopilin PulG